MIMYGLFLLVRAGEVSEYFNLLQRRILVLFETLWFLSGILQKIFDRTC